MKRTLAFLLSLMMVLSMLPAAALATEEAPVSEVPVMETPVDETPVEQPAEEELQLLADTATLTMSQTADNVVVTYTVPDTTTAAKELQLWKYDNDSGRSKGVTHEYCTDTDDWEGNTFTWVIDGHSFAEHGEGHYYCTTADGTVESSKLEYAYAQTAVQLAAPTNVVLNGDSLTWTCDNPVMAVIWQEDNGEMDIQDYSLFSPDDSITDLLDEDAAAGLYNISLFAYSRKDYVNNKPSDWVTLEYQYGVSDQLTRAKLCVLVVNKFDFEPTDTSVTFTDLDDCTEDQKEAILLLAQNNLVAGTAPGVFSPNNPVTGKVAAALLYRALTRDASLKPDEAVAELVADGILSAGEATDDIITKATFKNWLNRIGSDAPLASGTCGDNLQWSLSADYVLTITGTGAMADYNDAPWYDWAEDITAVSLPDGLTHLGGSAFYKCSALTEIDLPDSLESIGSRALAACHSLKSLHIPAKVREFGSNALGYAISLTKITVDAANTAFYMQDDCLLTADGKTLVACPGGLTGTVTLPAGITTVGSYAFRGSMAEAFVLPASLTTIENGSFGQCNLLESIEIPAGVTQVNAMAFDRCENLQSVTFKGNAPTLGTNVFKECPGTFRIYYDPATTGWTTPEWNGWPAYPIGTPEPLTRMDMVYLLVDTFGLEYNSKKMTASFPDVTDADDAEAVATVVYYGIMSGKGDDTFDPDGVVTRAQMAKLLTATLDLPAGTAEPGDLETDAWYIEFVKSVIAAGLMTVDAQNNFRPNDPLYPDDVDLKLLENYADGFGVSAQLTADNLKIVCTTLESAAELELFFSDAENGPYKCVDDIDSRDFKDNWNGRSYTWVPSGAIFAEHGEGWYYAADGDGNETDPVEFTYSGAATPLPAPTAAFDTQTEELSWTASAPVLAVIWQEDDGEMDILDYRRLSGSDAELDELLDADEPAGTYYFSLIAYSENQYRTNTPSEWTTVEYVRKPAALTRVQLCQYIVKRVELESTDETISFTDIADCTAKQQDAIILLAQHDIVDGYADGRFGPDDPATQLQAAIMLYRALTLYTTAAPDAALNWLVSEGILLSADEASSTVNITEDVFERWLERSRTPVPTPDYVQWDKRDQGDTLTDAPGWLVFPAQGDSRYRMDFYRVKSGDETEDVKVYTVTSRVSEDDIYCSIAPFARAKYLDDFVTGDYYAVITPMGDGTTTSDGAPVTSAVWSFTRPDLVFEATDAAWGADNTLTWESNVTDSNRQYVERYAVQFYFNPDEDDIKEADDIPGNLYYPGDEPFAIPEALLDEYGEGWYYFDVNIQTTNPCNALSTGESDPSAALHYTGPESPLSVSKPVWGNGMTLSWTDTSDDPTLVDRYWVQFLHNPDEDNAEDADVLWHYNYYANKAPHIIAPNALEKGGEGWYYFRVQARGAVGSDIPDSEWSELSSGCKFTTPSKTLTVTDPVLSDPFTADPDATSTLRLDWRFLPAEDEALVKNFEVQFYFGKQSSDDPDDYELIQKPSVVSSWRGTEISPSILSLYGDGWYMAAVRPVTSDPLSANTGDWVYSAPFQYQSPLPAARQATGLIWHTGYDKDGQSYSQTGLMSFKGEVATGCNFTDYTVELYRKDGDDAVSLGTVDTSIWAERSGSFLSVDAFSFFADDMETGTYYFTVTTLGNQGITKHSQPVKSPEWTYTRPTSELEVSNVSIGDDLSVGWTFDGDPNQLMEYKVEFRFDANGEKPDGNSPYWGDNIDPYGPPVYVPEDFLAANGNGTYYFRVRTISKNVEVAAPSEWSGWASVQYTAPNIAFEVSNPVWDGNTPEWEDSYLPGAPLLYYQIRYYYGKTADTINYDRCVWDTTYDKLPVQLPEGMLADHGEGYYTFKVKMVSSDLSEAKSSPWSEASPTYKLSLTTSAVNDQLEEINTETTSATDIQEAVSRIENLDKALAADAETGSDETLKTLEKLEAKVKEELNVDTHVEVSDNLAKHFDGSLNGLSFTAANMALNVDTDKADGNTVTTVQLNIAAAADSVQPDASKIDADSALVFSMNIENAADADKSNNSTDLKIPVQITLPVPAGINPAFLVILHEKSENDWEELTLPHVYEEDGQWYATFNVHSFSHYAMGEKALTAQAEGNTVTLQAHLPTKGVQTRYLCAVYSAQGQMLGMGVLQPQSDDQLVITLAQDVPAGATMLIFAPDAGSGWSVHSAPAPVTINSK